MNCTNCGRENLEKALICYWCGRDPATGELPYQALKTPDVGFDGELTVPGVVIPPAIEVPPPMPVPAVNVGMDDLAFTDLVMPDLPSIEITPPLDIPDLEHFTQVRRRRMRHRPVIRRAAPPPKVTRPVLPGLSRILVFLGGLGILFMLGSALVTAVGAASFGGAFCLAGLLGLAVVLWIGLLLARTGRRVVAATGATYERLEVLGRALREVIPGVVKELPVNLPAKMGVLDLPVSYSELRYLAGREDEPAMDLAVDLLTGVIASLTARDDVVLSRRTFPVQVRGMLVQSAQEEVSQPVITRRRTYVGPGQLEELVAGTLRTDRPMTIEELMQNLFGSGRRQGAQQLITWLEKTLSERPPDLEALSSPDEALAELQAFREALRQADPELYELLEAEVRRGLGAAVRRSVPSSLLDLARYTSTADRSRQSQRRPGAGRRG